MKTILVVDDSAGVRKFVVFSLKNSGFRVIEAEDGMDALEKIKDEEIHLLLTDLNMPNMDGFSLIKNIRETPEYRQLPIIILTTEDKDREKEKGMQLGASSYIVKPFKPAEILQEINKLLT